MYINVFIKIITTSSRFCPSVTKPGPQCNYPIKIKFIARTLISQLQYELQNRKGNVMEYLDTLKLGSTTDNDLFLNSTFYVFIDIRIGKQLENTN